MDGERRIVIAGASGDLGGRIAQALADRGAQVHALVRAAKPKAATLAHPQIRQVLVDFDDRTALKAACRGAACIVSALNGLEAVVIGLQGRLLDAAVAAGVPRFMPSDFSLDFFKTRPGRNRNLDLRRRFAERLDAAPIRATSILNGGFADLLGGQAPMVQQRIRRVIHWGDADQPLDFTTKNDVACFTAAAALDPDTPRVLRVAGDVVSARTIASDLSRLTGERYRPLRVGGIGTLSAMIAATRLIAPGAKGDVFPAWQGMQYLRDMMSGEGKLFPLDTRRYPDVRWTPVREVLAGAFGLVAPGS